MRTIDFRYAPQIQQTSICFPDDQHKTIVREDGSLNYNWHDPIEFEKRKEFWRHISRISELVNPAGNFSLRLKPFFTHRDTLISTKQSMESPQIPIVHQVEQYKHCRFSWTIFSTRNNKDIDGENLEDKKSNAFRSDIILWKLEAKDDFGCAPSRTELRTIGGRGDIPIIIESEGTTAYWTADGLQLPGLNHYAFFQSGETKEGVFAIIQNGWIDPETVTVEWARSELKKVHNFWTNLQLTAHELTIPDSQIQDMLTACARNILQAREEENGVIEYKVGPTIYRNLYMVDGYFLLEAAHILGEDIAFHQGILAVLRRCRPDGSIQIIPKHFKETGIAIATIVRQCELMGDDERLKELWPTIQKAVSYIRGLREEARALGPDYPAQGLFPPAYLDGGISGPYPDYTTPGWIMVGLKHAAEAGKRIGLPDAHEMAHLYMEIKTAFLKCADRDRGKTPTGISFIPMIMQHRPFNKPQSASWALAHTIYPGEVFDEDDVLVTDFLDLLDSIDDEQGIPKETGWIHHQAVWGYSAMFYAQVWLYAGHPDKAIDYLYAFANHASPARVWREEQSLTSSRSSEYCGDMPHNWGSAEFIRLVRNSLVMEKKRGLHLLAGLPLEWLPTKDRNLILENTPTKFGRISIVLQLTETKSSPPKYRFSYSRTPGVVEPEKVILHWKSKSVVLQNEAGINEEYNEELM